MKKVVHFLGHELRRGLPAFVFFLFAFHLLALSKSVTLAEFSITLVSASIATVSALIVAKAILLADGSKLAQMFSGVRIANILWKSALFLVLATFLRVIEELIEGWSRLGGLRPAWMEFVSGLSEPYFLVMQLWLFVLLFLYCLLSSLTEAFGRDRVLQSLFSARQVSAEKA